MEGGGALRRSAERARSEIERSQLDEPTGTIRKTQHAAIAHDRTEILALAAARRRRQRLLKSPPVAVVTGVEMDEETQRLLQESEETLLGMEA